MRLKPSVNRLLRRPRSLAATQQPGDPPHADDAEEVVARGRREANRRGVTLGALLTISGFSGPMFVEHVNYRLAGLGKPCIVVHPPDDRRRDAVVRLRDVEGPAKLA